jgi:restriction endonuclease Mrr
MVGVGVPQISGNRTASVGPRLFDHRVWWARTYLVQAGLLETPIPGTVRITD